MNNLEIAQRMRQGVAVMWPDASYQAKGRWFDGERMCFAQMLSMSLGCGVRDPAFNIAGRAICKAADINPVENLLAGVTVASYVVSLNEGLHWKGRYLASRPYDELVQLVHAAADSLDGGELPAEGQPAQDESLPQSEPPVDIPGPNPDPANVPTWDAPSEQPTPLPTAITNLLMVNPPAVIEVREKEYA